MDILILENRLCDICVIWWPQRKYEPRAQFNYHCYRNLSYMKEWMQQRIILGIPLYHIALLVLFFVSMGSFQALVIFLSGASNPINYIAVTIDYILMMVLAIPVWWLHFRKFRELTAWRRFLLHLATGLAYVKVWFFVYQSVLIRLGYPHSKGKDVWWDLYMGTIIYCIIFSIIHVYRFFIEKIELREWEKELQALAYKSEINALKAQIQPHFLFNTLNSISASVDAKHERTRTLIAKLADTFRYSLKASQSEWVSLGDEIDFIKTCLELENERFGSRLTFELESDYGIRGIPIPPMLLQPIVENAVRHGVAPSLEGGNIILRCAKQEEWLKVSIANTGTDFEGDLRNIFSSGGIGLRNTNLRLQKLYGQTITVERNIPSGLVFSFLIPISDTHV
jgi:signal transduction histidine kinase